ncbi:aspartate--tRNA ligase [Beduinella massiliensis]|uniref:aspartate--tRNA ligase n=1 Tax=Beduinella massiliensis TaxID=1852363 RepID=UPI000C84F7E2
MAEWLSGWKRTCMCGDVSTDRIGQDVTLMGWVQRSRNLGSLIFTDLRDRAGIVQVVFDGEDDDERTFAIGKSLSREYVLAVRGTVRARGEGAINDKMKTGQVEVLVREAKLLNKSETPPIYIEDDAGEAENVRLKYRYLDLRRPVLQNTLALRSKVLSVIRRHMEGEGFLEVETPILTKSTPEGARDYLVPSRVHPGEFYALPQSPQIYKQLLMLAGYDRYFQVARCFRDEDLRADRQPEFTQLDLEMSFVEPEDIQNVVEGAFADVFREVKDMDITLPLPRVTWRDAMDMYGSDKPDTRFEMKIRCVDELVKDCGFKVFEDAVAEGRTVRAIRAEGAAKLSRKEIDALGEFVKTYHVKGLAWATVSLDGAVRSSFAKFMKPEALQTLIEAMGVKPGDALFLIADKKYVALTAMGQLRLRLGHELGLIDKSRYDLLWITEFPLLEWSDEENRFVAQHHPFTCPMDEDFELMESDPGAVRAKAYDLVLNGIEMGSGSIRIHASDLQERMFRLLGFTHEQAWERFGFLLEAFKYGTPPHGGFAFGVDRLIMQITGRESLRDVIAFPKVQNASCLMMQTPSNVAQDQLDMLHIKTCEEEETEE